MNGENNEDLFRAKINSIEKIRELAKELKSTPTGVVNLLVDTGAEVLLRATDEFKKEIRKKLLDYVK